MGLLTRLHTSKLTAAGQKYASYALQHPDLCKVVAIAEPREKTRAMMVKAHVVSPVMTFNTWEDFIRASDEHQAKNGAGERLADAVVVAVQDKAHMEVVLPFASRGYHVLCEKPMATSPEECIRMADAVKQAGVIFGCGHGTCHLPL